MYLGNSLVLWKYKKQYLIDKDTAYVYYKDCDLILIFSIVIRIFDWLCRISDWL